MRHIIVVRNSSIAHNKLDKQRDQWPAVWTIAHHLKVNVASAATNGQRINSLLDASGNNTIETTTATRDGGNNVTIHVGRN